MSGSSPVLHHRSVGGMRMREGTSQETQRLRELHRQSVTPTILVLLKEDL